MKKFSFSFFILCHFSIKQEYCNKKKEALIRNEEAEKRTLPQ